MKKLLMLSAWAVLFSPCSYAQNVHLENPSFEYVSPSRVVNGEMPKGFTDCSFLILKNGSAPPKFNAHQKASHGESYLGLTVKDDLTWERASAHLDKPMRGGQRYLFHIEMSRNILFPAKSRTKGEYVNFNQPCKLRIWAGKTPCDQSELLAESGLVANHYWQDYSFLLSPGDNYEYLIFEAFYETSLPFPYNGNLLLDHASSLIVIEQAAHEIKDRGEVLAQQFEYADSIFGKEVKITFFAKEEPMAFGTALAVFSRGKEIENAVKKGMAEMETAGWSRFSVNPDFREILAFSLAANRETKGAFDTGRQQDLFYLWEGIHKHVGRLPNKVEIQDCLDRTGIRKISSRGDSVFWVKEKEILFDWSGIAMAHALDEMREVLMEEECIQFTIGTKGYAISHMKEQLFERAMIQADSVVFESMPFSHLAIATSKVDRVLYEYEGEKYFETMMPMRGRPLTRKKIVSVEAADCKTAYVWSQALLSDDSEELMGKAKVLLREIWQSGE